MELRTLLIDNYDSYTYNLFQLIAEVNGGAAGLTACCCQPFLAHLLGGAVGQVV